MKTPRKAQTGLTVGGSLVIHRANQLTTSQVENIVTWLRRAAHSIKSIHSQKLFAKTYNAKIYW